jgi:hypothetical protein
MRIIGTTEREWQFKFKDVRDKFPEEYALDREEGLTDQEFVEKTFKELGEERFSILFGDPVYLVEEFEISD